MQLIIHTKRKRLQSFKLQPFLYTYPEPIHNLSSKENKKQIKYYISTVYTY